MFKTNYLKFAPLFATFALVLLLSFGCEKEIISPVANAPVTQLDGYNQIVRPSNQCAPSQFANMQDGATNFGTAEILNNGTDLYLIIDLNNFKFLDEIHFFVGDKSRAPLDEVGNLETEGFTYIQQIPNGTNNYTMISKMDAVPACVDIIVFAKVSTRNIFGQVTSSNDVWMHGSNFMNGFSKNFCVVNCFTNGGGPSQI